MLIARLSAIFVQASSKIVMQKWWPTWVCPVTPCVFPALTFAISQRPYLLASAIRKKCITYPLSRRSSPDIHPSLLAAIQPGLVAC